MQYLRKCDTQISRHLEGYMCFRDQPESGSSVPRRSEDGTTHQCSLASRGRKRQVGSCLVSRSLEEAQHRFSCCRRWRKDLHPARRLSVVDVRETDFSPTAVAWLDVLYFQWTEKEIVAWQALGLEKEVCRKEAQK